MMVGDKDVCSIDQWRGSFFRMYVSAAADTFGSGLSRSRYLAASSGVETPARRLKYAAVVSLIRIGGVHAAMWPTASDRCDTALVSSGNEPWPEIPFAVTVIARGIFSTV